MTNLNFIDIDKSFSIGANYIYSFGRTPLDKSDEFFSNVEKIKDEGEELTKFDLRILYPVGTSWQRYEKWVSYFGIPFYTKENWWYALGKNYFKIHPTRGAYPVEKAYVFKLSGKPSINLIKFHLEQFLTDYYSDVNITLPLKNEKIIEVNIPYVEKFREVEKYVIQHASNELGKDKLFHFRTLLISENLIPEKLLKSIEVNQRTKELYLQKKDYLIIKNSNKNTVSGKQESIEYNKHQNIEEETIDKSKDWQKKEIDEEVCYLKKILSVLMEIVNKLRRK